MHPSAASRTVRVTVVGTPVATVVDEPKLDVMSLRTMPLSARTFGPLEPSPGYGPAVSSLIGSQVAADPVSAAAAVSATAALVADVALVDVESLVDDVPVVSPVAPPVVADCLLLLPQAASASRLPPASSFSM